MSVFGDIAGIFASPVKGLIDLAKKAWGTIKGVWSFLVHVFGMLTGAWDWMVNGVGWFLGQLGEWIQWVYNAYWTLKNKLIPEAVGWVYKQATHWAGALIHATRRFLEGLVKAAVKWAGRAVHDVKQWAKGAVSSLIHWVTGPIRWVLTVGRHIANLVLHPKALAEYIVGALIVPLLMWFFRSSAPVIAWLVRSVIARDSEIAHVIEDVLAKVI